MTVPRVGTRDFHLNLGAAVGAAVGAILLLPVGLWSNGPVDLSLAVPVGGTLGGALGLALATYLTTLPAGRPWIVRGLAIGALSGCAVGAICYARVTNPTGNPWPPLFPLLFTLLGAFIGLSTGVIVAERVEFLEHEDYRRKLDAQRAELETAMID